MFEPDHLLPLVRLENLSIALGALAGTLVPGALLGCGRCPACVRNSCRLDALLIASAIARKGTAAEAMAGLKEWADSIEEVAGPHLPEDLGRADALADLRRLLTPATPGEEAGHAARSRPV